MVDAVVPETAGFAASPFADAVLTPSHAVQPTGPVGDRAAPREGAAIPLSERSRPVIEIGRRVPLLTGRAAELDELSDRIRAGESIEIFAGNGFGKTSVVNLLVHDRPDLKGYFADGVVLLSGRAVAKGDLVAALFRTFFTADQAVVFDDAEMLRQLSPVRALIVLDDIAMDDDEFQAVVASLTSPVFVVTSSTRRLHDFTARPLGPMADADVIAAAELRLGHDLDDGDRRRIVELAHLLGDRPRTWARAIELVENGSDLEVVAARLGAARDPEAETSRLAIDRAAPQELGMLAVLSELGGPGLGAELSGAILDIDDAGELVDRVEEGGLIDVDADRMVIAGDVASAATAAIDSDRVAAAAIDRVVEWTASATDEQVVAELPAITAFAEWALEHDRAEAVVELGRNTDGALFRTGRWGAAAALLALVARAGEACERPADTAWAYHQMGVRELALGDSTAAKPHLREARSIRRRLGDKVGEALTSEHLKLLGPLAAIAAPFVAKVVLGVGVTAAAVTGGVVALGDGDTVPTEVLGTTTVPTAPLDPAATPGISVELDGARSVVVSVELAGELRPGEYVQVARTGSDGAETLLESTDPAAVSDRGLEPDATYSYRARVLGVAEPSGWSDAARITTGRDADTIAPDAPTGVVVSLENGIVSVTWDPSTADDLAGYDVRRDTTLIEQGVLGEAYTDAAPVPGSRHEYAVVAFDDSGNVSAPSEIAVVEIPAPTTTTTATAAPTSSPTASTAPTTTTSAVTNTTTTTVTSTTTSTTTTVPPPQPASNLAGYFYVGDGSLLDWTPSPDADAYEVRRTAGGSTIALATVVDHSYTDPSPPAGDVLYEVVAVRDGRESAPVQLALVVDLESPSPVSGLDAHDGSAIDVTWIAATDNVAVTEYEVSRSVNGGPAEFLGFTTTTGFLDSDSLSGEIVYSVVALDGAGNASAAVQSNTVDRQPPAPPTGIGYDTGTGFLSWTASASPDVDAYDIYYDGIYESTVSHPTSTYFTDWCDTDYHVVAVDGAGNESAPSSSVFAAC